MYQLTAADFADTGQWRLLLKIGSTGLSAFLENTVHTEIEPQPLCDVTWHPDKDQLRKNIEDAVYNNPRLLDDFATRIIIFDKRTLFIPSDIAEETVRAEEDLYKKIYMAEEEDIMSDRDKDITAVWCLAPGVKSFLMRTFPGARISCNLMEKVRQYRKRNNDLTLFAVTRHQETDLLLLSGPDLISAATHDLIDSDDMVNRILNLLDVYNLDLSDVTIRVAGGEPDTEAWKYLAKHSRGFYHYLNEEDILSSEN